MMIEKLITTVDILLGRSEEELSNKKNEALQSQQTDIKGQLLKLSSEDRFTLITRLTPAHRPRLNLLIDKKQLKEWGHAYEQVKTLELIKPILNLETTDRAKVPTTLIDAINTGLTKFSTNEERSALIQCLPSDKSRLLILLCKTNAEADKWTPLLKALPTAAATAAAPAPALSLHDTDAAKTALIDTPRRQALEAEAERMVSPLLNQRRVAALAELALIQQRQTAAEAATANAERQRTEAEAATANAVRLRSEAEAALLVTQQETARLATQTAAAAAEQAAHMAAQQAALEAQQAAQLAARQAAEAAETAARLAAEAAVTQARLAAEAAAASAERVTQARLAATAAVEAERQRAAAAAEAERQRVAAAAEAERQRVAAAAEAERQRLASDAHHVSIAANAGF